ncbi:conserved hypothetical protein [Theileria equi strain WA]|uniref:Uncharacterized protein n=1 Tax=Theileria equi strain WA TaxID=1537102 RepID=L1LCD8_THEEQ|nr:conserved hypothetical protein [Theileria equi strain WA]EKX72813.1 conserved hypothetical protein [Theileria equi strain WA]|eukprot:XP_004832265.1 conserved hypothetical protein [Theileria equi strain WA]
MAKIAARPFFPQNDSTSIWTKIELVEPHPNSWNPYKDVSAGSEVHPIPVENNVDQDLPPMGFTYIRNNVFFSRLPNFNLEPVCAGCVPHNIRPENCHKIAVSGFCKGFVDSEGKVYCEGINKKFLSAIRSRASCSDNCPCPNTCRNRLPDGIQIPVKLVKAPQLGWALHTRVPLRKGTFIMQYVGEIICRSEMAAREHHYDKLGQFNYCMESVEMEKQSDDWQMPCIDSMVLGNIARFLNHSCEPNVEVITVWKGDDFPSIAVYALCDIAAGDALTYCYGNSYRSIPCLCGTKSCRGFIGSV